MLSSEVFRRGFLAVQLAAPALGLGDGLVPAPAAAAAPVLGLGVGDGLVPAPAAVALADLRLEQPLPHDAKSDAVAAADLPLEQLHRDAVVRGFSRGG